MKINKNIFFFLCFFLLGSNSSLWAQQENAPEPNFQNPYNAMHVHLYYLQPETYQPEMAGRSMRGIGGKEAERKAIQLKQVFDGKGLYVYLNLLPQQADYVDSITGKAYYTPFPETLPEVYLEKKDSLWQYSSETIGRIDQLHKEVFPFGIDRLLNWLPKTGQSQYLGLALWQYAGIALLILLVYLMYFLLGFLFKPIIQRLSKSQYTIEELDGTVKRRIALMVSLFIMLYVARILLPILQLPIELSGAVVKGLRMAKTVVLMFLALRILELAMAYAGRYAQRTDNRMDEQLLPIVRRLVSIVIVTAAIIQLLSLLDVNVAALIAGVSIGGLALALAAQDTVKNLIGSAMIFIDRPFQIGDYVVMNGVGGTVVEVGFRSTRIRMADTSVVAIPNGIVANQSVENKGVRVYRLLNVTLGLKYDTPPPKIEQFMASLRQLIADHPLTHKEDYYVHFSELGASSLNIMFRTFLSVPGYADELKAKEEIFLSILRLAEEQGVEFAFPSTSIYLEGQQAKMA
ncbi:MAG: mechanosensitive ion channel family protein [Bacteroidota bacterium]